MRFVSGKTPLLNNIEKILVLVVHIRLERYTTKNKLLRKFISLIKHI